MNDEIKDAIDNFYRLKQEYHNNVISEQKKIMKNKTLTKQQKKLRLRDIKGKCVNCGSSKGTIFSQTDFSQFTALSSEIKSPQFNDT